MQRGAGILCHISSLPSKYGIGTFGKTAYDFVDFLVQAGQKYWQILPLGPTSFGDSPYQSFSTFAGNPYFIDLEMLIADKLLTKKELKAFDWGLDDRNVDYKKIYDSRFEVLEIAKKRGFSKYVDEIERFRIDNRAWLDDYALFMACKRHFGMKAWSEWDDENLRLHKREAVDRYTALLYSDIELFIFIQFYFFKQYKQLKKYTAKKGIKIIGDIPIYVSFDSADVWANPKLFELDEKNLPIEVAGVPPDYFSKDGQLWGNPLYDWEKMRQEGYSWWFDRIEGAARLYDVIRIDHFRGFDTFYAIRYGQKTAREGRWRKGPGYDLVGRIIEKFPDTEFIAEDLGDLSESVHELLEKSGLPGMKILEFAFDSGEPSNYQPHTYERNCVCYTGTHDNAPVLEWMEDARPRDVKYASVYLGINEDKFAKGFIRGGMRSVADLFVAQIQDYIGLGRGSRMNLPGTPSGNWRFRFVSEDINKKLAKKIKKMTKMYGR